MKWVILILFIIVIGCTPFEYKEIESSKEISSEKDSKIRLGAGEGPCHGSSNWCEEKWVNYAKGVYYDCWVVEKASW